jgi:ubiquinol-cytochrome c reductase subunit 7
MRENEIVKEALRRLPAEVYQERNYRLAKAVGVSANKAVLPKEEWITPEQVNFCFKHNCFLM